MMENGLKINITEKVYIIFMMGLNMKEIGEIINLMGMELLNIQMGINMKEIIKIISSASKTL